MAVKYIFDGFYKFLNEDDESESMEEQKEAIQYGEVYYFIAIFCLYALTGYSVMIAIKGREYVENFNIITYISIMAFAFLMYFIFRKWNYPAVLSKFKNIK